MAEALARRRGSRPGVPAGAALLAGIIALGVGLIGSAVWAARRLRRPSR